MKPLPKFSASALMARVSLRPTSGTALTLLFGLAWIVLWFVLLGARPLGEPDEGRYAEVAREMLANHNWLTPTLDGFHFFDKPIWLYWMTALSFKWFDVSAWSARLWVALASLLSLAVLRWSMRQLYDAQTGTMAAAVLGSCFLFFAGAHIATTDMGVAAFISIGLCLFMPGQCMELSSQRRLVYNLLGWASLGLAMLSKGLIALVLPGMILLAFMVWERRWAPLGKLSLGWGVLVFGVVAAPWFVAVSLKNPDFFTYFFVREHFQRFLTAHDNRQHQWWFFLMIVTGGLLPWSLFAAPLSIGHVGVQRASHLRLLRCWAWVIVMFFSLSRSKLPFYVLPAMPAFAMLVAANLRHMSGFQFRRRLGLLIGALLVTAITLLLMHAHVDHLSQSIDLTAVFVRLAAGLMLILLAAAAAWRLSDAYRMHGVVAISFASLLAWQLLFSYSGPLSQQISARDVAAQMAPHVQADTQVFAVGTYYRGLPFYLGRYVTVVDIQLDDLVPGLASRPTGYIQTLPAFAQAWRDSRSAVALVNPAQIPALRQLGVHFDNSAVTAKGVVIWR